MIRKLVRVSVEYVRLFDIDAAAETFGAVLRIVARWHESDKVVSADVAFDPRVHWNPKLYVENATAAAELREHFAYYTVASADSGTVLVTETKHIRGTFSGRAVVRAFPVELLQLSVRVTSALTCQELQLVVDASASSGCRVAADALQSNAEQRHWNVDDCVHASVLSGAALDYRDKATGADGRKHTKLTASVKSGPSLTCTLSVWRKPAYGAFSAIIFMGLLTTLTLTTFAIDCKVPQDRLQATFMLLIGIIVFKWTSRRLWSSSSSSVMSPTSSHSHQQLSVLDKQTCAALLHICALSAWHALVGCSFWSRSTALAYDAVALYAFAVLLVGLHGAQSAALALAQERVRRHVRPSDTRQQCRQQQKQSFSWRTKRFERGSITPCRHNRSASLTRV